MVVVVHAHDVEHHPPVGLGQLVGPEPEGLDALQVLVVAVGGHQVVVEVGQRAQRDHVEALTGRAPVEALGHEVAARALGQQPAGHHVDPGRLGHLAVGELDAPVRRALPQPVAVPVHTGTAHAVQLDQPLLEAVRVFAVGRVDLEGLRVEGDDGLGPRTAGTGAHLDQLLEGGMGGLVAGELAAHRAPGGQDQVGQLDRGRGLGWPRRAPAAGTRAPPWPVRPHRPGGRAA